jgi:hypothetical protein
VGTRLPAVLAGVLVIVLVLIQNRFIIFLSPLPCMVLCWRRTGSSSRQLREGVVAGHAVELDTGAKEVARATRVGPRLHYAEHAEGPWHRLAAAALKLLVTLLALHTATHMAELAGAKPPLRPCIHAVHADPRLFLTASREASPSIP